MEPQHTQVVLFLWQPCVRVVPPGLALSVKRNTKSTLRVTLKLVIFVLFCAVQAYVFDVEDEYAESDIPTTLIRSKADCPGIEVRHLFSFLVVQYCFFTWHPSIASSLMMIFNNIVLVYSFCSF